MRAIAEVVSVSDVTSTPAIPTGSGAGDFISIIIMLLILGLFVFGAVNLILLLKKSINKEDTTKYKKRLLGCIVVVLAVVILMFALRLIVAAT